MSFFLFIEVTFYPVGDLPFSLRPLKDLRDNKNSTGYAKVFGPEIIGCKTREAALKPPKTTTPASTLPPIDRTKVKSIHWYFYKNNVMISRENIYCQFYFNFQLFLLKNDRIFKHLLISFIKYYINDYVKL